MGVEITDRTSRAKAIRRRIVRGVAGLSSMATKMRPAQSRRRKEKRRDNISKSCTLENSQRKKAARRTHAWRCLLLCSLGVNPDRVVQPHREGAITDAKETEIKGETRREIDAGKKQRMRGNERTNAGIGTSTRGVEEMKSKSKSKLEGTGGSGD